MAANEGTCPYCGSQFRRGWVLAKHIKACAATILQSAQTVEEARDVVENEQLSEDDGNGVAVAHHGEEVLITDAFAAIANLCEQTQPHHPEQYCLNAKHLETLKFLGPMCAGLPVAEFKLKAMLKYAKSLDTARVRYLPKTPATAWRRLAKVRTYPYCCIAR
jgi:hypothetical protein